MADNDGYQIARITVRLTYRGAPVDLELEQANTRDIEQLIDRALKRKEWAIPRPAGWSTKPRQQVEPFYAADGTPCCPHHKTPLKAREWGLSCSTRVGEGDPLANRNGYCKYTYKEPGK